MKLMTTRTLPRFLFVLMLAGLAACSRVQPVMTVHQQLPATTTLSDEQLREPLIRALTRAKWTLEEEEANRILARIDFRQHSASITIDYAGGRYDIRYRDSHDLDYADGKIHKRYNALVKKLNRVILQEVRIAQNLTGSLQ
ncbi:hypothetical protein [Pseudomonas sp. UBA6323]|uniref:hypothetical protein n=1 Tax=Pseudomonas sp. UBA6323 TaxID=1947329 RepID=UPI0025E296AA|nr:hypothetical protein [Pseudomonas sp. UBA6323]